MEQFDIRVDAFIAKSADFAKPILTHLRQLVHQAYPEIRETIKWGFPFFDHKGSVCYMSSFKQHCAFGFWKSGRLKDKYQIINKSEETAAGNFGRITTLADLPSDELLIEYISEAAVLNELGIKVAAPKKKLDKTALIVPDEFIMLLDKNTGAKDNFNNMSRAKQKEYLDWFTEAKTAATKQKRIQSAIKWITEGKSRMWKYE